jgi:TPP-dependent pyruvate/acetoin dehydrogenase alpha subunit
VPDELLDEWSKRDPIDFYSARLRDEHGIEPSEIEQIRESVATYVDECTDRALASPMPDPAVATEGVFADRWEPLGDGQAPWSRWSQEEVQAPQGNGHSPSNGHRPAVAEQGRAA